MSNDRWPMIAALGASAAAVAALGQVIIAAIQAGEQGMMVSRKAMCRVHPSHKMRFLIRAVQDQEIHDLRGRLDLIEHQLQQEHFAALHSYAGAKETAY